MRKSIKALAVSGVAVAALAGAGSLAGVANAATGPVSYTTAGVAATAGWNIKSISVDITHVQGRFGTDDGQSWKNLPVAAAGSPIVTATAGQVFTNVTPTSNSVGITGGIGQELCDTNQGAPGYAAQEGIVQVSPGHFDVIEAVGLFNATGTQGALNSNGDVCDNGLLGVATGSKALELKVLLTGVGVDSTDLNTLYNAKTNYSVFYHGHNIPVVKGRIFFGAQDLHTGTVAEDTIAGAFIGPNFTTNEAAQGVVADTTAAPAVVSAIPAPNTGVLLHHAPGSLVRVAHSGASGNPVLGGHETSAGFFATPAWTASAVAATDDGTASGRKYLVPSAVGADNFYVLGGQGLIGG